MFRLEGQRLTKVVFTLNEDLLVVEDSQLQLMIRKGMDMVRLEFAKAHFRNYRALTEKLRRVAGEIGAAVGLILEIPGINRFASPTLSNYIEVSIGQVLTLTNIAPKKHDQNVIMLLNSLTDEISIGDEVKFGDGQVTGNVTAVTDSTVTVEVTCIGVIERMSRVYISNVRECSITIQEKCLENYTVALTLRPDFISFPFSTEGFRQELLSIRQVPGNDQVKLLAKIRSEIADADLEELIEQVDGIVIARYHLGMEMPIERICVYQKHLAKVCQRLGKPVLISGQVLGSLRSMPYPLRADASDVYNGVLDGVDGFILAQEVLMLENWENTMEMLTNIIHKAEETINYRKLFQDMWSVVKKSSPLEAISSSAAKNCIELDCKLVICITRNGESARLISKYKTPMPVLAVAEDQATAQKVTIYRGCFPIYRDTSSHARLITELQASLKELNIANVGDIWVVLSEKTEQFSHCDAKVGVLTVK